MRLACDFHAGDPERFRRRAARTSFSKTKRVRAISRRGRPGSSTTRPPPSREDDMSRSKRQLSSTSPLRSQHLVKALRPPFVVHERSLGFGEGCRTGRARSAFRAVSVAMQSSTIVLIFMNAPTAGGSGGRRSLSRMTALVGLSGPDGQDRILQGVSPPSGRAPCCCIQGGCMPGGRRHSSPASPGRYWQRLPPRRYAPRNAGYDQRAAGPAQGGGNFPRHSARSLSERPSGAGAPGLSSLATANPIRAMSPGAARFPGCDVVQPCLHGERM